MITLLYKNILFVTMDPFTVDAPQYSDSKRCFVILKVYLFIISVIGGITENIV